MDEKLSDDLVERLSRLFKGDDHCLWYLTEERKREMGLYAVFGERMIDVPNDGNSVMIVPNRMLLLQSWGDISLRMQTELEVFLKARGTEAGLLTQNLREVNRERYDYTEFLKKFAVRAEMMKINPDEFDYNFYTYGLELYENMPLIEPLEYKEVKRIREFVVAIDTSGSTSGDLVQTFVQKTYNILKSTESFLQK